MSASREDFGLTPLEAGYFGKPSAVLRWGGFLDTVIEDTTGVYFDSPDPDLIVLAVEKLLSARWDAKAIQLHMDRYSEANFSRTLAFHIQEVFSASEMPTA